MKKDFKWVAFFILIAIFLRFFSFFPSLLDHDESTYMIIGNELLKGKLLYSDITDTKPVGTFMIYAGLQYLFGYSIFMKRLFVAVVVGLTSFLIYRGSCKLFKNKHAALAAGIIYIFYTSLWIYHGLSPNTELYFNLTTIAALLLFLKGGNKSFFRAGLVMGVGFMLKYMVLLDYGAFMLFFFLMALKKEYCRVGFKMFFPYLLSGLGFLMPFAFTALYFYLAGRFDDFYYITFVVPGFYRSSPSISNFLVMLGDVTFRFFPITFFFFYALISKQCLLVKEQKYFFLLWILMILIAMLVPGKDFGHYTIQLMLPVSLIAGLFFHSRLELKGALNFVFRKKSGLIILIAFVIIIQVVDYSSFIYKPDQHKEVARYLKENLKDEEIVFVSNYEPIVYYLLKQNSPTKYLLFSEKHTSFRSLHQNDFDQVMHKKPKFVLIKNKFQIVKTMMGNDYKLKRTFRNGEILVYQLNEVL